MRRRIAWALVEYFYWLETHLPYWFDSELVGWALHNRYRAERYHHPEVFRKPVRW